MNTCSPTVFYPVFLSCIINSRSIPSITMVVTKAVSNSLISSEVMNWYSFLNNNKKSILCFCTPCICLLWYHSVLLIGSLFIQCVISCFVYTHFDVQFGFDLAKETPSVWSPSLFRCPHQFWEPFLAFWHKKMSLVHLCVFCLRPEINHFSENLFFFSFGGEWYLEPKILNTMWFCCYWSSIASRDFL